MILTINNWLNLWIIIEFFFLLNFSIINHINNNYKKEIILKIFIFINIISLIIFINIICINNILLFKFLQIKNTFILLILLKLNYFPFHYWTLITTHINWIRFFIINYLIKLPNIIILNYLTNFFLYQLIRFIIIIPLINLNFLNLKKTFIYLSLNNFYWLIIIININNLLTFVFLINYFLFIFLFIINLNKNNINYINQLIIIHFKFKLLLLINLINLIGIPPFNLFIYKWIILYFINFNYIFIILLIITHLLIIFTYRKIIIIFLNSNFFIIFNKKYFSSNLFINLWLIYFFLNF